MQQIRTGHPLRSLFLIQPCQRLLSHCFLAISCLLFCTGLTAQTNIDQFFEEGRPKNNSIRWDASELIIGMLSVSYERSIQSYSIEVGAEYQLPYFVHPVLGLLDPELSYFQKELITGGFGYYLIPRKNVFELNGDYFWLGGMFRSRNYTFEGLNNVRVNDYCFMAGNEFKLTNQLDLNYSAGLGLRVYTEDNQSADPKIKETTGLGPVSFKLSYRF